MKIIKPIIISATACLLSALVFFPRVSQADALTTVSSGQQAIKVIVANRVLGSEGSTSGHEVSSDNISDVVEFLSPVAPKRESVSNVGTQHKTDTAPECRKHKCQNGLTDEEWEQGFHMFILCFFVAPLLSTLLGVIAGAMGWLSWLPWMRD